MFVSTSMSKRLLCGSSFVPNTGQIGEIMDGFLFSGPVPSRGRQLKGDS